MTEDILVATTQLADAIALENAALQALDFAAAGRVLDQKQTATTALAAAQRRAMTAPAGIDRTALRTAATRLQTMADENRRLLERALRVQNRVLGILAQAARAADPTPRYARSGGYAVRPNSSWAVSASA